MHIDPSKAAVGAATFLAASGLTYALLNRINTLSAVDQAAVQAALESRALCQMAALHDDALQLAGRQGNWLTFLEGVAADPKHPLYARVSKCHLPVEELAERWNGVDFLDAQVHFIACAETNEQWLQELFEIANDPNHPLHPDWLEWFKLYELHVDDDLIESFRRLAQLLEEKRLESKFSCLLFSRDYWRTLLEIDYQERIAALSSAAHAAFALA